MVLLWDKMNFFNGLRIQKDLQDYYHYSKKTGNSRTTITLIKGNNLGYSVFRSIEKQRLPCLMNRYLGFIQVHGN